MVEATVLRSEALMNASTAHTTGFAHIPRRVAAGRRTPCQSVSSAVAAISGSAGKMTSRSIDRA